MSFAILRIKKHSNFGTIAGMGSHVMRTRNTPNADPDLTHKNKTVIGSRDYVADVKARLDSAKIGRIRKNGVIAIEHLMTASPDYFKQKGALNEWYKATRNWLEQRYGRDNIVSMTVHLDETTPHAHAVIVPIEKKNSGRFVGQERLNARAFTGGREKMSEMQDSYAAALSHLGLERGIKGSKARHRTVRSWYAEANNDIQKRQEIAENQARANFKQEYFKMKTRPGDFVAAYQRAEIEDLNNQIAILKRQKSALEMENSQKQGFQAENKFKPS